MDDIIFKIIYILGVIVLVFMLSNLTGMINQPLWFSFIYNFPLIYLLISFLFED